MSEFKPTSKPGSKEYLVLFWRYIKHLLGKGLMFILTAIVRVIVALAMAFVAVALIGYFLFYGSTQTGDTIEKLGNTLRNYRI